MSTLSYLDEPSNIRFFHRNPVETINSALRDFCHKHGIPEKQTDGAVLLAVAHYEGGASPSKSIEFGKDHVRLWIHMNPTSAA